MTSVAMVRLVMGREIHHRLRSRAFAISTVALCAGVVLAGVLTRVFGDDDDRTTYELAVVGDAPPGLDDALRQVAAATDVEVRITEPGSRAEAERQVRDGDVDAAIDADAGQLLTEGDAGDEPARTVDTAWRVVQSRAAAERAGLDQAEIDEILSPSGLEARTLDPDDGDDDTVGRLVGTIAAIVLFISINAFGGLVLTGVVEEKTTGVVEVLLAHVRAHQLLAGKVFGIGVVAMAQLAATVAAGLVALRISGTTVPAEVWFGLPTTILWYVLGFVLYSTLFALAGSFVSRQEDAQSAAAPISLLFTAGYLAVFVLGTTPDATVTRVISVLPPFAPLLMPLRVAVGSASIVEIVIAAVGLVAATFGMLRLAGTVYGRTLLHRGSRLQWKQALRLKS